MEKNGGIPDSGAESAFLPLREEAEGGAAPLFRADTPWLAPLAGWSDLPFRLLCREYGAAVCCTEMVSAKGLVYGSPGTRDLLLTLPHEGGFAGGKTLSDPPGEQASAESSRFFTPGKDALPEPDPAGGPGRLSDVPLVVQLFGSEPEFMSAAAEALMERGFRWFDCNMGCSVPKVTRTGAGAALLRDPDRALAVAEALIRAAGKGRVGFKLRLGWEVEDTWRHLAGELEARGAGWLTLHPRTARAGFGGAAKWEALAALKAMVRIPVIASGDLFTAEDGIRCLRETAADTVMYARGALRNPGIFAEHAQLLRGESPSLPDAGELKKRILRHAALARAYSPEHTALLKMRTIVPRYIHLMPGAKSLRQAIIACRTWEEFAGVLRMM